MLIDITRLAERFINHRLPTGVDRVSLQYVERFAPKSRALVRFAWRWIEFGDADSQALFRMLLGVDGRSAQLRRLVVKGYFSAFGSTTNCLLLNTGHSGLDHFSYQAKAQRRNLKPVFFLHDLIPISHAEYCRPGESDRHHRRLDTMLSLGVGLVVNSSATRDALEEYAANRRIPVPPTVVASLAPARLPLPYRERPLQEPYFVVLGTIEPRKNHLLLLHLWRNLVNEMGEKVPKLVVIGRRGWECEQVVDLLDRCTTLKRHVIELSRCEDRELSTWLAHAQSLLFPSFTEGFGMPLVEALMLRVPVIASDLSVFREIAGDIPLYLDPLDGPSWRQAILAFLNPMNVERQAQIGRMANYAPPTWEQHFAVVEDLLRMIDAGA